jgi:hypothetical protein
MAQARSNIAVSNDCISGVFTPNVVILINSVDRTTAVQIASLRLSLNRNDEPDSAEFTINRDEGFTPSAGQSITVGLGDSGNVIFGGQITTLRYVRESSGHSPRFDVVCTDWTPLFNRRLITRDFSGESATDIAEAIVEEYTSGFTTSGIQQALATIDEFICINETPMGALVRLGNLLGGGAYVDAAKRVHLWDSTGPSSYYTPSPPATLTNSLDTLKVLTPEYEYGQLRTRVIVEGASGQTLVAIPAGADTQSYGIPLDGVWINFNPTAAASNYVRVGLTVATYDEAFPLSVQRVAYLDADAAPGDTSITIRSAGPGSTLVAAPSWLHDGDGHYFYIGSVVAGPPITTGGTPASGYGSIPIDLPLDAPLYELAHISNVSPVAAITEDIPVGTTVVVRSQVDDSAAQTAIAAIEGGDGIHEHFVSDGELSYSGCVERANAELDAFSAALLRADWVTQDMQAMPGAEQVINMSSPSALSATLMIDSVSVTFPVDLTRIATSPTTTCSSDLFPLRVCQGSTVKLANVLDAIGT